MNQQKVSLNLNTPSYPDHLSQRRFDLIDAKCDNDGLLILKPHYLFEAGTTPSHQTGYCFSVLCECNHLHTVCVRCAKTCWECHGCGKTIMFFVY